MFHALLLVWEDDAYQREGVLNFCSIMPHGGFFYVPSCLKNHRRLGGLVYAFGEQREELEVPVSFEGCESLGHTALPGLIASNGLTRDTRVCVVCLTADAEMATVPCGHRAYCSTCSSGAG